MREHWYLDPNVTFLNHGSFGACPKAVLEAQSRYRRELEQRPVQFLAVELAGRLASVREQIGPFVGASPDDFAFVRNATEGVNAVLRSLHFERGDELLTTSHAYGACANTLRFIAEQTGAKLVVADVPFPILDRGQVVDAVLRQVSARTRLALLDHVTSATGLVFPIKTLVRELRARGVETLVDGAHAPGMVDLDIEAIGAGYYAANFHKWLCAPKGSAMLWVRTDLQKRIFPTVISHGFSAESDQRFRAMFDWMGSADPTAWLCIPDALREMADLVSGGWRAIRKHNHELALFARDTLCTALGVAKPAPDDMLGALASVPLPPGPAGRGAVANPLYRSLLTRGFEVLVLPVPSGVGRVLRVSAQLYNSREQYQALAALLPELLESEDADLGSGSGAASDGAAPSAAVSTTDV